MGRPIKDGLDYFPFDVSFFQDIKVRKLIKYQGCKAIPVYTLLLCTIYQNGYYMMWDQELPFIISETTGYEEGYVNEVIACTRQVGLFSEEMFQKNKVLTSRGIQERYEMICRQAKRKFIIDEFSLIGSEETIINTEETRVYSESSTQRKVKESKVKERRKKQEKEVLSSSEIPDSVKKNQKALEEDLKENPPQFRAPPLTMDEYETDLRNNRAFLETACMTRRATEEEFNIALRDFFLEKKLLDHKPKSKQDVMQHFLNWFTIWKAKAAKAATAKTGGKTTRAINSVLEANQTINNQGGYFAYSDLDE